MKSFIPWIGGKSQLRNQIMSYFPPGTISRYIEVFGGAGWLLFASQKHAPMEVFNDIDGHLINLYRCIKYHCKELQRELKGDDFKWLPTSRELFIDYLSQMEMRGLTDIQRAARYFYLIRISFGADIRTFGCKDSGKSLMNAMERLPEIQQRLQGVVIENRDFEALLKTYDRNDALIYLDPPYYGAEKYYKGFEARDHERLLSCLLKVRGQFLLSYNNHPVIKDMYSSFTIHQIDRANNLTTKLGSGQEKYRELIITNY